MTERDRQPPQIFAVPCPSTINPDSQPIRAIGRISGRIVHDIELVVAIVHAAQAEPLQGTWNRIDGQLAAL